MKLVPPLHVMYYNCLRWSIWEFVKGKETCFLSQLLTTSPTPSHLGLSKSEQFLLLRRQSTSNLDKVTHSNWLRWVFKQSRFRSVFCSLEQDSCCYSGHVQLREDPWAHQHLGVSGCIFDLAYQCLKMPKEKLEEAPEEKDPLATFQNNMSGKGLSSYWTWASEGFKI